MPVHMAAVRHDDFPTRLRELVDGQDGRLLIGVCLEEDPKTSNVFLRVKGGDIAWRVGPARGRTSTPTELIQVVHEITGHGAFPEKVRKTVERVLRQNEKGWLIFRVDGYSTVAAGQVTSVW